MFYCFMLGIIRHFPYGNVLSEYGAKMVIIGFYYYRRIGAALQGPTFLQCLSQDLETGWLKLVVVKFLGVQILKGDHNILIFNNNNNNIVI